MKNSSEIKNKEVKFEEGKIVDVEAEEKGSLWQRAKKFANDHKVALIGGAAAAIGLALKITNQRKIAEDVEEFNNEIEFEEDVTEEDQVSES